MGLFRRLKASLETIGRSFHDGLAKTRQALGGRLAGLFRRGGKLDDAFYEELEEALIAADVGVETAMALVDELREAVRREKIADPPAAWPLLEALLLKRFAGGAVDLATAEAPPTVYVFVGVNGVGKTTTIGKLAHRLAQAGHRVLLAAGDTFRAGAIEQLQIWGERSGVPVVAKAPGSDPAAVVYEAIQKAKAEGFEFVLCDTAGRLQNKVNLMNELNKIVRVAGREVPGAPHEVLLVLDATTGQNALLQAKAFREVAGASGIVLTKLDGTAKGGVAVAVREQLGLPVKLVGLGEGIDDLQPFEAEAYVRALLSPPEGAA
ncbi:signal recognition particle-docking protein FtsY [Hydrogenibacillus schlegelii]|uniref:Signal recognition particle receptor FtsY n=1 Tax=Hydrogenibacillus schlegelii TaxID=1484 RepID=A0A132N7Z2_HYDSH|nr:signal recognition particle-docking protein FtsY [Hydrogenibacillus schlegelii]KWX06223.1 cell division protein FtsY [Hydrogenibacillus schlegelii]MBT9281494.1 signal recognition particle-docking protein FtsY [Hydrogenibacillus schlegelii]OAR04670.1 signal recognition particle-docking protein FtsY [Hydrogenibacillus schlegelii]